MTSDPNDNKPKDKQPGPEPADNGAQSGPPQVRGVLRPSRVPRQPAPEPEPPDEDDTPEEDDAVEPAPAPGLLQPRGALTPRGRSQPAQDAPSTRSSRGRALSGEVLPAPIPSPSPYYLPEEEESLQESLLRNPYVLAALAVAGAILLAVIVVFLFGGGDGSGNNDPNVIVDPLTPIPGRGVTARSIATATVREGPAAEYLEIGLLRSGQDIEVVGRNNDSSWFQIFYPPRSQLRGWVPASALRLPDGSSDGIPVVAVTPIPRPTVIQPTPEPQPTETVTPTPTVTGTPGAAGGPDLAISIVGNNCEPGQSMVVMIRNAGTTLIVNREIRIIVSNPQGVISALSLSAPSIEPGASLPVQTNQPPQPPRTTVRVELLGSPVDINNANNAVECVLSGGGQNAPTPTRTPRP